MPESRKPDCARGSVRLAGFSTVLLIAVLASGSAGLKAAGIEELSGRWSGWGALRLSNGAVEQVKCVATYFVTEAGSSLDQNLRCASAGYKIDAKANYIVSGGTVRGTWEERTHSARGEVAGNVTNNLFRLTIFGDTFSADMTMSATRCKQSIRISPSGLDIENISIGLEKC